MTKKLTYANLERLERELRVCKRLSGALLDSYNEALYTAREIKALNAQGMRKLADQKLDQVIDTLSAVTKKKRPD